MNNFKYNYDASWKKSDRTWKYYFAALSLTKVTFYPEKGETGIYMHQASGSAPEVAIFYDNTRFHIKLLTLLFWAFRWKQRFRLFCWCHIRLCLGWIGDSSSSSEWSSTACGLRTRMLKYLILYSSWSSSHSPWCCCCEKYQTNAFTSRMCEFCFLKTIQTGLHPFGWNFSGNQPHNKPEEGRPPPQPKSPQKELNKVKMPDVTILALLNKIQQKQ